VSTKPPPNRAMALALTVAAAAALATAAFSHRWLDNPALGDFGFGLLAYKACDDGVCASESMSSLIQSINDTIDRREAEEAQYAPDQRAAKQRRPSKAFVPFGIATFVCCLIGAVGLAAAALLALAKKTPDLPIAPTTIALLGLIFGIVAGCVWVAIKPDPGGAVGVGWSFWVYGIGSVVGLAAALMINRHIRPIDTEPGPPPTESMAW
jgi:hypothetical protein